MNEKDLLLSIDNGTQSMKALVFDLYGNLIAKESVVFSPYFSKYPGWAEQDPEVFWSSLCEATQVLWNKHKIDKDRIAGISLTTQRGTVVNVDSRGTPLRPAMLWLDQRKAYGLPPLGGVWGIVFKLLRLTKLIDHLRAEAEMNWIRTNQPEIWNKTHKYLLLSGYLTHKLTNNFIDSVGCQVGYLPFDYKHLNWASDRDWRWKALPIDRNLLPDLLPPGRTLGFITKAASRQTGIPAGLPVKAAAADKACELVGSGALEPSTGCISYGTAATINVIHNKYREIIPMFPAYPAIIPNHYNLEFQIFRGYWMVSWFKKEFGHPEIQEAAQKRIEPEILFDEMIKDIPPGSMGLTLQPFWSPGLKFPGPDAKGAIIGFGDIHTRAHIYRAMLEGIAYALREGKEHIEKTTKIPITSLRIAGGGSQSRNAMQLTADIFNLPASRPYLYEASGLGAAISLAVSLGYYQDFRSAIDNMVQPGETFEPNIEAHRIYDQLYRDVYKKMYRSLIPLYQRIREITGYPA